VPLPTRQKWFDDGAAALERAFPGTTAAQFGPEAPIRYACPICDGLFERSDLERNVLTVEHVPPAAIGGKGLVLTCKPCNNESGDSIDADLVHRERIDAVGRGEYTGETKVFLHTDEGRIAATLIADADSRQLHISDVNNPPGVVDAVRPTLKAGVPVQVEHRTWRFAELGANLSLLKAGFLALFAIYGYRLSRNKAYEVVRRQILNPDTAIIRQHLINLPPHIRRDEQHVVVMRDLACHGVMMRGQIALFPFEGDESFYDRLAGRADGDLVTGTVLGWPSGPTYGQKLSM